MTAKKRDSIIRSVIHGRGLAVLVCVGIFFLNNGDIDATTATITEFGAGVTALIVTISKIREAMGAVEE